MYYILYIKYIFLLAPLFFRLQFLLDAPFLCRLHGAAVGVRGQHPWARNCWLR